MIRRGWLVLAGVCAIYCFASAATFQSMGVVVFAMAAEFGWSEAAAGGSFLALGLTCCASSLLPVVLIPRIGGRWTIVAGCLILAAGFATAWRCWNLDSFMVAAGLFGVAFSLMANTTGIYLTAGWFGERAPRMIGVYLTVGALGGVAGPPVAQALVSSAGGWRGHWACMAVMALGLAALCALLLREPPAGDREAAAQTAGWAQALLSWPFAMIAASMVMTQICLLTVFSVISPHVARLGGPAALAASLLSVQALVGAAATAGAGWVAERIDQRRLLVAGLLAQAAAMLLLAYGGLGWSADAFAVLFGLGWSGTSLAVTVLLVQYFGHRAGSTALSAVWTLCGVAAFGPSAAGLVADRTGSFAPGLAGIGVVLVPLAAAGLLMREPSRQASSDLGVDLAVVGEEA